MECAPDINAHPGADYKLRGGDFFHAFSGGRPVSERGTFGAEDLCFSSQIL